MAKQRKNESAPQSGPEHCVKAGEGDIVKVRYTGWLEDGTAFGTDSDKPSIHLTIGEGTLIPGFENALQGMRPKEVKTVRVPCGQAFGPYRRDKQIEISRQRLSGTVVPRVGARLKIRRRQGPPLVATVLKVAEESLVLDTNHPLAGENLTFEIELQEIIRKAH